MIHISLKLEKILSERTVSSSSTIRSLATICTSAMYIFFISKFGSPVEITALLFRPGSGSTICRSIWVIKDVQKMAEELT